MKKLKIYRKKKNIKLFDINWKDIVLSTSKNNESKIKGIYDYKINEKASYNLLEMKFIDYYILFLEEDLSTFLTEEKENLYKYYQKQKYNLIIKNLKENFYIDGIEKISKYIRFKGLNTKGKKQKGPVSQNTKGNKIPKELKNFSCCYYEVTNKEEFEKCAKDIFNNVNFDPKANEKDINDYIYIFEDLAWLFFYWFYSKNGREKKKDKNEKKGN